MTQETFRLAKFAAGQLYCAHRFMGGQLHASCKSKAVLGNFDPTKHSSMAIASRLSEMAARWVACPIFRAC